MKKTIPIIITAAMLLSCTAVPTSVFAETTDGYEVKAVEAYKSVGSSEIVEWNCLFEKGLPEVPFVNTEDYISQLFSLNGEPQKTDGVFVFENGDCTMTIDADKDTILFDFYEGFLKANPAVELGYGESPFVKYGGEGIYSSEGMTYVGDIKGVELPLGKYNIDIVEYGGDVYIPYCTLNDIFINTSYMMTYKKNQLRMISSGNMGGKGSLSDTRSSEFARFMYDEFCFAEDCFNGKPSKAIIGESIKSVGLDKTLETYNSVTPRIKELLLSESSEDFCTGIELLQFYLDDGGHTMLDFSLNTRLKKYGVPDPVSAAKKVFGENLTGDAAEFLRYDEFKTEIDDTVNDMLTQRSKAYGSFELVKDWRAAKLYRSGSTYFFEFSDFSLNIIEPFKEALDIARDNGCKNFVLETNGGGNSTIAVYMMSLMSDNVKYSEELIASGNRTEFTGVIDKNLDGVFDEKDDAVKYDMRFAVLTNCGNYSCGNLFAGIAKDSGICVIGERTAGGSCCVTVRLFANGTAYNVSGYSATLRADGSDPDNGVEPDIKLAGAEDKYESFYDVSAINKGIAEFYGDPLPEPSGLFGDLDGDEQITANDALIVLRASVGMDQLSDEMSFLADDDADESVTANDALAILRTSVGMNDGSRVGTSA